jgi:GMP synthase-like glutamine amidotransferase
MGSALKRIAIIDCAIQSPSLPCFLKMRETFNHSFSMHSLPQFGMSSILKDSPDGWIIFGSHSNVSDQLDWHQELSDFIQLQLNKGIPTLGICFGHQLMAHTFGAKVSKTKQLNQGLRKTTIIQGSAGLKKGEDFNIFTSHKYEVSSLSDQLTHVGRSDRCQFDMVSHKTLPYFGLQGHPESSEFFIQSEMNQPINKEDIQESIKGGNLFIEVLLKNFFC